MENIPGKEPGVIWAPTASAIFIEEPDSVKVVFHRDIEVILPKLRRYALSLTRDAIDADDLVQECVARGLAKLHLWEAGTDLRAWLFSILHNQYVNQVRHAIRQSAAVERSDGTSASTCAPRQIDHLELRELEGAIMSLPEQQRTAGSGFSRRCKTPAHVHTTDQSKCKALRETFH